MPENGARREAAVPPVKCMLCWAGMGFASLVAEKTEPCLSLTWFYAYNNCLQAWLCQRKHNQLARIPKPRTFQKPMLKT